MLQETLHQLGTLHAVHVGGPVVYLGRGHQLAPWAMPVTSSGFRLARAA
jgi:hypothetical protein